MRMVSRRQISISNRIDFSPKHSNFTNSPEEMESSSTTVLPRDVEFDILARLPVKSLLRFRPVSKRWCSTIANPNFITSHIDLNLSRSSQFLLILSWYVNPPLFSVLICYNSFSDIFNLDIPFDFPPPSDCGSFSELQRLIVGSVNGLLCLTDIRDDYSGRFIVLWNPSLRKFKSLTESSSTISLLPKNNVRVALGFGFDSKNNDYKIVRIVVCNQGNVTSHQAEIYSLSSNSWRNLVLPADSFRVIDITICSSPFVNGALHWIASISDGHRRPSRSIILCFDLVNEEFRTISLPQCPSYKNGAITYSEHPVVFRGSLALILVYEAIEDESLMGMCSIWVMREYGVVESWTEKLLPIRDVEMCYGCTEDGKFLLNTYFNWTKLVLYDPETSMEKNLDIKDAVSMTTFRESLMLLE